MRAHDAGIGLAVAWARRRGLLISGPKYNPDDPEHVAFLVFNDRSVAVRTHYYMLRGPVVDPEAIGPGSWIRVPTSGPEMLAFGDALLRLPETPTARRMR